MSEKLQTFPTLSRDCHKITHAIGSESLKKFGDFGLAMQEENDICNSGYMHGVIGEYFKQNRNDLESLKNACIKYTTKRMMWHCYHGIGHGLMIISENDINWSLGICKKYDSEVIKRRCANGVFMEYFTSTSKDTDSDPLFPCNDLVEKDFESDCYMYVPEKILFNNNWDFQKSFEVCSKIKNTDNRHYCVGGTGSVMLKENAMSPDIISKNCQQLDIGDVEYCFGGAIWRHLSLFRSESKTMEFCNNFDRVSENECSGFILTYNTLVGNN